MNEPEATRPESEDQQTPTPPSFLAWPPPGLGRIQGDIWVVTREFAAGGLFLVLPLLWLTGAQEPFSSVGPLGDAWWIVLVTSLIGLITLATAFTDLFRLLRRVVRAGREGYGWKTAALVASDGKRDTGFLVQSLRQFSVLGSATRKGLVGARLGKAWLALGASIWIPVSFTVSVMLASRGYMGPETLVTTTLVPAGLMALVALVLRAGEQRVLRQSRRQWFRAQPSAEADEPKRWRETAGAVDSAGVLSGQSDQSRLVGLGAAATLVAAVLVVIPSVVLVGTSGITPVLLAVASPQLTAAQQRAGESEPLRRYRVEVNPAMTPEEAGQILHVLVRAGGPESTPSGEHPPVRSYDSPILPANSRENPTGILPDLWGRDLFASLGELSPDAIAYVRTVSAHPALEEWSTLAGAS